MGEENFTIEVEQVEDYEFKVRFDEKDTIVGKKSGFNPSQLLTVAAANCLTSSLLYCLVRADIPNNSAKTFGTCYFKRDEKKRLRIDRLEIKIQLFGEMVHSKKLKRCMELFENYCVVSQSIREGIPVDVKVLPPNSPQKPAL